MVGMDDGTSEGTTDGTSLGTELGVSDGARLGSTEGSADGPKLGSADGPNVGSVEASKVGNPEGPTDGGADLDGAIVGMGVVGTATAVKTRGFSCSSSMATNLRRGSCTTAFRLVSGCRIFVSF